MVFKIADMDISDRSGARDLQEDGQEPLDLQDGIPDDSATLQIHSGQPLVFSIVDL